MLAALPGQAAQNERPPTQLAGLCAACHRLDNKPNGIPPIVSLDERQITAMMRSFKERPRSAPMMHVVARTLSDDEIVAVAHYISELGGKTGR